jgi:DNA-binding CsgD family transcriptional regulator
MRAAQALMDRSPFDLYREGHFSACLAATANASSIEERTLHVRALMRLSRHREALDAIARIDGATPEEKAKLSALQASCHVLQGAIGPARRILAGVRSQLYSLDVQFELSYAQMHVAWLQGDPQAMQAALDAVDVSGAPHLYGRWLYASSWVAALRGAYLEQLSLLRRAIECFVSEPAAYDISFLASATRSLVHLVREIVADDTFEFAVRTAESIRWTEDLETERFLTFRGLAWAHALRGSHEKALQYAYFARDIAPSVMWITACYADQAYLARMAAENRSADALLDHAIACAKETDWTSRGEERVALLNLAELVADRNPATARTILDIYDGIAVKVAPGLAFARDLRLRGMEDYVRGTVLAASGDEAGAVELLERAYATFSSIRYAWRAAAAALRMHAVTREHAWLARAGEAVADFPESSVANEIRKKAAVSDDPRFAALTPAQKRVYALLCEGLGDKQIAQILGISPETARNHGARVRAAFGVHSRAALIAAARRGRATA